MAEAVPETCGCPVTTLVMFKTKRQALCRHLAATRTIRDQTSWLPDPEAAHLDRQVHQELHGADVEPPASAVDVPSLKGDQVIVDQGGDIRHHHWDLSGNVEGFCLGGRVYVGAAGRHSEGPGIVLQLNA